MFYLITKERLLMELTLNAKSKGKGVLNWFIKNVSGVEIIYIIYDVYGIKYMYSDFVSNFDKKLMFTYGIDFKSRILGVSDKDFSGITDTSDDEIIEILNELEVSINDKSNNS